MQIISTANKAVNPNSDIEDQIQFDFLESDQYLDSKRQGYAAFLVIDADGETKQYTTHVSDLALHIDYHNKNSTEKNHNVYLSQAMFANHSRKKENLASIKLIFIDLDYYNITALKNLNADDIKKRVYNLCDAEKIPRPSITIDSGKGVYIKWILEHHLPRKALKRWDLVQNKLIEKFDHLGADSNAKDASRVLRLVGSVNHKTGNTVTIIDSNISEQNEIETHNFSDFADNVLPYTNAQIQLFRQQKSDREEINAKLGKASKATKKKGYGSVINSENKFTFVKYNQHRYQDLIELVRIRFGDGGCPDGQRDLFAWLTVNYMALAHSHYKKFDFWRESKAVIAEICPKWTQTRLEQAASAVFKRLLMAQAGETVEFNGKQVTPLYTHRTSSLIRDLSITVEEQRQLKAVSYTHLTLPTSDLV